MSRAQREDNLSRLCGDLENYAQACGIASSASAEAAKLSKGMFLSHATSQKRVGEICRLGKLLCPSEIAALQGTAHPLDSEESELGTTGYVFLYAAPFGYPRTSAGWLFSGLLEENYRADGMATPFDSGGLAGTTPKLTRTDVNELARDFLARHELPLPEHRQYMHQCLVRLFACPADYVNKIDPRWPGPVGLTGGDHRRWTHEVRIPGQLQVKNAHLAAFFVAKGLLANHEVRKLVRWYEEEGFECRVFNTPRSSHFEALRQESVDYIRQKLL